jgi:hypothetical protein
MPHAVNFLAVPVVSEFISSSIDAAAAEYVAPKSLTIDLQQLISGDDIQKGEHWTPRLGKVGILRILIFRYESDRCPRRPPSPRDRNKENGLEWLIRSGLVFYIAYSTRHIYHLPLSQ